MIERCVLDRKTLVSDLYKSNLDRFIAPPLWGGGTCLPVGRGEGVISKHIFSLSEYPLQYLIDKNNAKDFTNSS